MHHSEKIPAKVNRYEHYPDECNRGPIQDPYLPFLSTAKRGFVSRIPLYKIFNYILYRLHTGCQWAALPIERDMDNPMVNEISWWAVYHHFHKWSRDGSLERGWQGSILTIQDELDLSVLNLDGSHALARAAKRSLTRNASAPRPPTSCPSSTTMATAWR